MLEYVVGVAGIMSSASHVTHKESLSGIVKTMEQLSIFSSIELKCKQMCSDVAPKPTGPGRGQFQLLGLVSRSVVDFSVVEFGGITINSNRYIGRPFLTHSYCQTVHGAKF